MQWRHNTLSHCDTEVVFATANLFHEDILPSGLLPVECSFAWRRSVCWSPPNLAVQSLKKFPACMNSKASPCLQKAFIRAYSKLVRSWIEVCITRTCRSQWPLGCWDCGFESRRGHVCLLRVLSGRGLCVGLSTCQAEPYRVSCVWVWSWSLYNEETLAL